MRGYRFVWVLKFLLFALIAVTVFGWAVMALWNSLLPALFGVRTITFWQAVGVLVLSRILFGRFGGSGGRRHWRGRMRERLSQMTPEEREKFMAGMNERCGR